MDLSVVVPVHNEAENIDPLLDEIVAALTGRFDYEIIYVNDGSRDDTGARLTAAQARIPNLRVLTHRRACGQSTAVVTGIRHARGRLVATLDGDGQNDPADIPRLVEVLSATDRPARLVMAAGYRRRRQDTWIKRFSSRIANGVRSRLLGDATPDTGCGLKVFERAVFLELPYFDHMHRFLPALVQRYLKRVQADNPVGALMNYPGSPLLIAQAMREDDRLAACELHPDEARALATLFKGDPRVGVHARDGYGAIKALLPPKASSHNCSSLTSKR